MVAKKSINKTSKKSTKKASSKVARSKTANAKAKTNEKATFTSVKSSKKSSSRQIKKYPKRKFRRYRPTKTIAIIGLVINFIVPGLGTIIGGRNNVGFKQLLLFFTSLIFGVFTTTISSILFAIAWIWALISSIHILRFAR